MHRDSFVDDHVGQRQRTGKTLLGEQSLRVDAPPRATGFIWPALDDDLTSVG